MTVQFGPSNHWNANNAPAAGTAASASQAAAAGAKHVCTGFAASFACSAAPTATVMVVQILDGSTVLWEELLACEAVAGDRGSVGKTGLNLIGSVNTAMTVKFTAGVTSVSQAVSMQGYDLQQ